MSEEPSDDQTDKPGIFHLILRIAGLCFIGLCIIFLVTVFVVPSMKQTISNSLQEEFDRNVNLFSYVNTKFKAPPTDSNSQDLHDPNSRNETA